MKYVRLVNSAAATNEAHRQQAHAVDLAYIHPHHTHREDKLFIRNGFCLMLRIFESLCASTMMACSYCIWIFVYIFYVSISIGTYIIRTFLI